MKKSIFYLLFCMVIMTALRANIEFPLTRSLAGFYFPENSLTGQGNSSLLLNLSASNTCVGLKTDSNIIDLEYTSIKFHFRYGITPQLVLELSLKSGFIGGGFMDGIISGFHNTFGLPDGYRNNYPRGSVTYRFQDRFLYQEEKAFFHNPTLSLLYGLVDKKSFKMFTRVSFNLPLNSLPGFTSDKISSGIGLICLFQKDDIKLENSNYFSFFSIPSWLGKNDLKSNVMFYSEIKFTYKWMVFGVKFRTSPLNTEYFSDPGSSLIFGLSLFKGRLELFFHEDLPPFHTTPDAGLELKFKVW